MFAVWPNLNFRVWQSIRRVWNKKVLRFFALFLPTQLSARMQGQLCRHCNIPMEPLGSSPAYAEHSRCPRCGLIKLKIPTLSLPRHPISSPGIINLEQRRNAKVGRAGRSR